MRAAVRQLLVAAGAVVLSAGSLQAQSVLKPFSFGIMGGATVPTGDAGDVLKSGYNVGALLELKPAIVPLSFRVEGGYQNMSFKDGVDGNTRIISGVANVAYRLPVPVLQPYVIGGAGMYNIGGEIDGQSGESQTKMGLNGGVGVELSLGISTFIEGRYHTIFTEGSKLNVFPVTVGFRF